MDNGLLTALAGRCRLHFCCTPSSSNENLRRWTERPRTSRVPCRQSYHTRFLCSPVGHKLFIDWCYCICIFLQKTVKFRRLTLILNNFAKPTPHDNVNNSPTQQWQQLPSSIRKICRRKWANSQVQKSVDALQETSRWPWFRTGSPVFSSIYEASVKEFFERPVANQGIPNYQRPYCWKELHVRRLLRDILIARPTDVLFPGNRCFAQGGCWGNPIRGYWRG